MPIDWGKIIQTAILDVSKIFRSIEHRGQIFTEKDIQKYFEHLVLNEIPLNHRKLIHQEFPTPNIAQIIDENAPPRPRRGHFDFAILNEDHFENCSLQNPPLHPALQVNDNAQNYYEHVDFLNRVIEFKFGRFQSNSAQSRAAGIISSNILIKNSNNEFESGHLWDVIKLHRSRLAMNSNFIAYWFVFEECGSQFNMINNNIRIHNIQRLIAQIAQDEIEFYNEVEKNIAQNVLNMFLEQFNDFNLLLNPPVIEIDRHAWIKIEGMEWLNILYVNRFSNY